MNLNELRYASGAVKKSKKVGRGPGSGHGKTACRGHKGQNARSGGGVKPWFEGGQMPLQRRVPKRGFTNIFRKQYQIVNLSDISRRRWEGEVTPLRLKELGLIANLLLPVKVLGDGKLETALTIKANAFSKVAAEKIQQAGGKAEVI
ncbi:MAG: 50S ribosomal protein L15 [Candidatus Latescibacteria bacterium]|nr:50S ribosomal protein L15 [Candidatus Latescibacterota bacterium]